MRNVTTRYGGWWLEPSAKTPAHGAKTTPWVAFSRLAPPPPVEMVGKNARRSDHPEVFSMKLFHGGTFTPTPNRRLGIRAFGSDDDIVYLSKFVKDNKVIEVYIEHGETTVESYYMPTFTEKLQLKELNNNDEVVELDEELPIVPHTRKRKFLGIPKCRKTLAIEWLSNDQVGQHSGLGGAENASGEDNAASGDENYATADENDNVDGVEDIVDDEHIIDQVDVNMEGFRFTANSDERDTIRPQVNINEDDLEVIDYDEFESELDEDDIGSTRRAALRKLRKKGNADNESGIVNHFFLGQELELRCVGIVPSMDDGTMESSIGKRSDKAKKGKNVISEVVDDKYKCQWSVSSSSKPRNPYKGTSRSNAETVPGALKDGFKAGGRDLIGLDGAFMKAPYEGQLLTAVSVDANNGIYPVAYGIVESDES
ncbi:hypothetical protein Tco_0979580 [Tanacetum coccineum]